jgi:hypothetical protein
MNTLYGLDIYLLQQAYFPKQKKKVQHIAKIIPKTFT